MQFPKAANGQRPFGQVDYVIADSEEASGYKRHDYADNPCQTGSEEECAEWLNEQLTACYND